MFQRFNSLAAPYHYLCWAAIGALFYLPGLGATHLFDWDEINFAEISREMLLTGDYLSVQVNFHPFWEKPPLFFWMQALSMKIFGVNEFAARLPNALCGMLTLPILFGLGKEYHSVRFGHFWSLCYFGSVLPFLYFKSGILDPWFNLLILISAVFLVRGVQKFRADYSNIHFWSSNQYAIVAGLFCGLAMLVKGPVAYLILTCCLLIYLLLKQMAFKDAWKLFVPFSSIALLLGFSWHAWSIMTQGETLTMDFLRYQLRLFRTADAGHSGFPAYHVVILLLGMFPASILALLTLFKTPPSTLDAQKPWRLWMKILFWVVLILFSLVQSKIVHYSSLAYFPIAFFAAVAIEQVVEAKLAWKIWLHRLLLGIGSVWALAMFIAPYLGNHIEWLHPLFKDQPFALANLEADVKWWYGLMVVGIAYLAVVLYAGYLMRNHQFAWGMQWLFCGTALFLGIGLMGTARPVEAYTQGAAIRFYQSVAQEDCYIHPYGFKTYAHLFYAQVQPAHRNTKSRFDWLLNGPIDKPVYFVCKIGGAADLRSIQYLKELYQENGFVFFKREITAHPPAPN